MSAKPTVTRTETNAILHHNRNPNSVFLPVDWWGRTKLGVTSLVILFAAAQALAGGWPPPGVAPGIASKIFLGIIFELMIVGIPLSILELCWAIAMPDWVRRCHDRVHSRVDLVVLILVLFGLVGMICGALGLW